MTDTTAPLAVTMADIDRLESLIPIYENAADWSGRTHPALAPSEHHITAKALRAVATLLRRCLEPDGETVLRVAKAINGPRRSVPPMTNKFTLEHWQDVRWDTQTDDKHLYLEQARAAIAALVNPDGK